VTLDTLGLVLNPLTRKLQPMRMVLARASSGRQGALRSGWQDRLLAKVESGVDPTLIRESLKLTPTERLERMRAAAEALEAMKAS